MTHRDLETNDTDFDYIVPLDQEIDMVYAFLSFSADWREHNKKGNWSMKVHKGLGNDNGIAEPISLIVTSSDPKDDVDDGDESIEVWIIILIVVCVVIGCAVLIALACYKCKKSKRPSQGGAAQ